MCALDHITPSRYVSLYVIDDRVALIFGKLFMGLFLGAFFSLGPVIRSKKKTTWQTFEAGNKIIGSVRLHLNSQTIAKLTPLDLWRAVGAKKGT